MKTIKLQQIAALAFSLLLSAAAWAAPTSGTPYNNDPKNEYVQDATSDAINNVNMILCVMDGMNMSGSGMVNQGPYVALVDMNKCKSQGGSSDSSSSSSGASASVNYMTAIVNVTRASTAAPMIANVWISQTEQGRSQDIYVKVSATSSPTDVPPYGVFRLDFQGKDSTSGAAQMNGYIDSASGLLQYFENGANSSNVALALSATQTTSGYGTMKVQDRNTLAYTTYNFNYDTNNFRRSDGANDRCFDRLKANACKSVWRYGTYKDLDGSRVDQANPSFQITATYGGNSYYGYASYWGIGFQGLDLNTISGTNPISNFVVTDQRPGHTSDTYSLSKVGGKLTKWTKVNTQLSALNGIPFIFYGDLSGRTTPAVTNPATSNGWGNWQMVWNNTGFTVTGLQTCGAGGCILSSISPATVNTGAFNTITISGWSDSFGGNLNIPPTGADHVSTDTLSYFSQSVVIPGSAGAPTALYCLSNCPDAASVTAAQSYSTGATASPFNATTTMQWGSAPPSTGVVVSYAFDAGGLKNGSTYLIINNPAYFAASPNFQYGVQTGRLFDTAFTYGNCPAGMVSGTVCEPSTDYYTWSTSRDQWNQSMWLTHTNGTSNNTVVTFDPPQNIQFTVSSLYSTADSTWLGKNIQLQFNGFGNLGGIPGSCVDPVTNAPAACSQNTRYVPAFAILDGAPMTLTLNGTPTTIVVKALDAEIRLNDIGVGATVCPTLPVTQTLTLPTATGNVDVSAVIGTTRPTVSNPAPKVIDGVVQY